MAKAEPPIWAVRTRADREAMAAGCYWDSEPGERLVNFAEKYCRPKVCEGKFGLLPWQRRFLLSLRCWRKPDGTRRFRHAVLHTSKKSGKTLLVSILTLAELFISEEPAALAVSLSTSRDNASQVYKEVANSVKGSAKLTKHVRFTENTKRLRTDRGTEYFAAAADQSTGRGFNASLVVCDEAAWQKSRGPWDSWQNATVGRANGQTVIISTAGDPSSWYYGEYCRAKRILSGEDGDQSTYAEIYECPPDGPDGWMEDPKNWKAASPSLDQYPGYTTDNFRSQLLAAKGDAGSWLNFRIDRLNLWLKPSAEAWLDLNRFGAGRITEPVNLNELPCWLACDLSQTTDPSTVVGAWLLPDNRFYLKGWAWVARKGVERREKQLLRRYDELGDAGQVVVTDGDMIDQSAIKQHLLWMCSTFNVQEITSDAYNAIVLMSEVEQETGKVCSKFPQNFKHYTDPCKQFERAINEGRVKHSEPPNGWLTWCIGNVRLAADKWGNVMPDRKRSVDKIDGAVASIMAFALANQSAISGQQECVYNSRPVAYI